MLYQLHEWQRAFLGPLSEVAETNAKIFSASGMSQWPCASHIAAGYELIHRLGKNYEKPAFNIHSVQAHGQEVAVLECVILDTPFCQLKRFKRFSDNVTTIRTMKHDPVVLLVAPLSGHHATLLRDTVLTLLGEHEVYITDWVDARMIPNQTGPFGLDDYVKLVERFISHIGAERLHVIPVCQSTVPVLAAVSLMAARGEPSPLSLIMIGGPIDPRCNPTRVNKLATTQPLSWFKSNMIYTVPTSYPGCGREVYPGFLQHLCFIGMNPVRHLKSHWDLYQNLISGAMDDVETHRRFYNEYNAVLDIPAQFYLDTISTVFQKHLLPQGLWKVAGEPVTPAAITGSALLTLEGELDDISGLGQTEATHRLCINIPAQRRMHRIIKDVGHYGIFSGRRWREFVYPKLRDFIRTAQPTQALTIPVGES